MPRDGRSLDVPGSGWRWPQSYLEPSKLARRALQSGAGATTSRVVDEPKPGMELKRFIFLRSFADMVPIAVGAGLWPKGEGAS